MPPFHVSELNSCICLRFSSFPCVTYLLSTLSFVIGSHQSHSMKRVIMKFFTVNFSPTSCHLHTFSHRYFPLFHVFKHPQPLFFLHFDRRHPNGTICTCALFCRIWLVLDGKETLVDSSPVLQL